MYTSSTAFSKQISRFLEEKQYTFFITLMIVLFAGLFFLAIFQLTAKRAEQRGVPEEALLPGDSRQFYKPYSEVPYSEVTDESRVNTAAEQ